MPLADVRLVRDSVEVNPDVIDEDGVGRHHNVPWLREEIVLITDHILQHFCNDVLVTTIVQFEVKETHDLTALRTSDKHTIA